MGEDESRMSLLREVSEQELFHLQNGLDVTSLRELVVRLRTMEEKTFEHHVGGGKNDFSTWVKDVFGEERLSRKIQAIKKKDEMADMLEQHLLEMEDQELERFGIHVTAERLGKLERAIEKLRKQGLEEDEVKTNLLQKGWHRNVIDLVLTGKDNPYREYRSLDGIEHVEEFHEALEQLKRHVINAVGQGSSLADIKAFLKKLDWHDDIIGFTFYDIFKPHPNLKKLARYVTDQVKNHNKPVSQVKQQLLKLGWKEYIVDSVIYGLKEPSNTLNKILSYLDEFSEDHSERVKGFLLQMGWDEMSVDEAIRQKEFETIERRLQEDFNLSQGEALKEHGDMLNDHVLKLDKDADYAWNSLLEGYRDIHEKDLSNDHGELHLEEDYDYYYSAGDLETIKASEKGNVKRIYYHGETKPLLIKGHGSRYVLLPQVIKRRCVVCGERKPVAWMKKVEMWDGTRTHKVTKYACPSHADKIESLVEDNRIIQT